MQGYFLYYRDVYSDSKPLTGIERKVHSQVASLNRQGVSCQYLYCPQPEKLLSIVASCLPLFSDGIRWPDVRKLANADFLYIRRPRFASKELLQFLSAFRKVNADALVLYEVPTFPYDGEMSSLKLLPALMKDRRYRTSLKDYVNYAVCVSDIDEVFGIPTVQIRNGIDLQAIAPRRYCEPQDEINILFVAYFEFWHGADRAISGLAKYYQECSEPRNISIHMCGEGSQLPALKKLARHLGVSEHIKFHGALSAAELDPLFDSCSMAFECLGLHRRKGAPQVSASLKSREYLAKGIPFINSNDVDVFLQDPVDFCLRLPASDDPVDFNSVVAFHDELYGGGKADELMATIRGYAELHVGIDSGMENVAKLISGWKRGSNR